MVGLKVLALFSFDFLLASVSDLDTPCAYRMRTPHHHEFVISYYIAKAIDRAGLSPLSRLLQSACLATRDASCSDNASPCFLY